jgi:hypothetical protein
MSIKKTSLQIICLALAIWLLAGCGSAPVEPTPIPETMDLTGHWEDVSSAFSLDLSQAGDKLQGNHVVVAQQGNKIDSMDKSIEGIIRGNIADINFQSSFTTNIGTATITFIDQNTIFWKVTNPPDGEFYFPNECTLIRKMSASIPSPVGTGTITGRVHLVAPPTPRMVVYAVDKTTGAWAFTETQATDSEATFSIVVLPGSYQLFAFSDIDGYAGYSLDGWTLAVVSIAANQTISDIVVRPPSQSECGSTFGVPAAPDGRFAAIPDPSADCVATILTPAAGYTPPQANPDAIRIQFQPNATDWYTPGDLTPNAKISFVLYAQQGQQMIVNLTTEPDSSTIPYASLYITAADGTIYTPNPTTNWTGVLPASQDYYIEVRSMSQQSITYTLVVNIPVTSNP